MLKLRKVELVGFKSFCEKTHLTFSGTGLSCIIGPNGCGKSNIVDAISWVLGEQSHKSLRAERMADCIFNGTAKRAPTGMAEVTLTLVDQELADAARHVLGAPSQTIEFISRPAEPHEEAAADARDNNLVAGEAGSNAYTDMVGEQPLDALDSSAGEMPSSQPGSSEPEPAGAEDGSADPGAEMTAEANPAEDSKPLRKNRRGKKPLPQSRPGEVIIARRLYRSGQSEYVINGRSARLRDIQDLFMGIGLGPDSYAIIEQGRIGQVLSSKPSDRRAIIEEAAGITKFKTKKRLAEAKLEASKVNLSRVNDIYVEVEKQLASLKRQASKAKRYAELREQMRGLLRQILSSKARELDAEAERVTAELSRIAADERLKAQSVGELEGEQQQLDRRSYELEAEVRQNQNLIGQVALELDRSENRIVFNRRRGDELQLRSQQIAAEREQAAAQLAQVEARVGAQADVVARLREEAAGIAAILSALAARANELTGTSGTAEQRIGELRRQGFLLEEKLKQLQREQAQAEQSLAHHSGALERVEQSEQRLLGESRDHEERSKLAESRWEAVEAQTRSLEEELAAVQLRVAELRRDQQVTSAHSETLRDALAGARARHQTLQQILNDRSYTAEAVQKLFAQHARAATDNNHDGFRAAGVLADYAEVEPQYENAVEQFLREELEYVVVETFDHARAGIELLRQEVGGRATFFVDSLRALNLSSAEPSVSFADEPALVSRLDRLVQFRDPLGATAKQFLPRLQSAFLVEAAESAERLARENPAYNFLTPDGTCYQGRAVTGGRPAAAGPLVMKRELRALETEALRLEHEAAEAQASLEAIEIAQRTAQQSLSETTAQHVEAGKLSVAAKLEREQSRAQLARTAAELSACQAESGRLREQAELVRQRAQSALEQATHTILAREAAQREAAEATASVEQIRQLAQVQQEEIAVKRAEKAGLDERFSSAAAIATRMEQEQRELIARSATLESQQRAIEAERQELTRQSEGQQEQVIALQQERQRLEARKAEMDTESETVRKRTAEVDNALRMARQTLTDLREERSHHEVERARNGAEREHLREACVNELNAQPEDLIAEQPASLSREELTAADAEYQEMKSRMVGMGAVNMMALEEYNECDQRFAFLGREREDLLQSIADTQQAIGELDEFSRHKFEEAFAIINTHFTAAFQTLFGGGTGQMRLSEADSAGDSGIDIAAQPPGKRLQNVLLLSGGEKALTALALLIAIFRYQPSPFCILDEVDAPLDETNVGRFAQMVAEMSVDAQFIVVTHNRRTMEMASVLYGVTMQEPGVSKLVSVNWDEARAAAASNAA